MPLYFYAPFPMGGVLLCAEIAPAVDGVEIFVVFFLQIMVCFDKCFVEVLIWLKFP